MKKNELISAVSSSTGLTKGDVARAVDGLFAAIVDALKQGEEVRLAGFGTFKVVHRAASQGRNPQTGEMIAVAARNQPRFKAGKPLVDAVN